MRCRVDRKGVHQVLQGDGGGGGGEGDAEGLPHPLLGLHHRGGCTPLLHLHILQAEHLFPSLLLGEWEKGGEEWSGEVGVGPPLLHLQGCRGPVLPAQVRTHQHHPSRKPLL